MYTKVDEKMFRVVKLMLKDGETISGCADYFNLSHFTVSKIKAAEDFTEYKSILAAYGAKKTAAKKAKEVTAVEPIKEAPAVVEHKQSITVQATHFMEQNQRKQIEALELISRKLTALLEAMQELNAKWN